jgi:hypothetical protein
VQVVSRVWVGERGQVGVRRDGRGGTGIILIARFIRERYGQQHPNAYSMLVQREAALPCRYDNLQSLVEDIKSTERHPCTAAPRQCSTTNLLGLRGHTIDANLVGLARRRSAARPRQPCPQQQPWPSTTQVCASSLARRCMARLAVVKETRSAEDG